MNRYLSVILLFFTFQISVNAQTFGNEWIDYSQKYYGFPVLQSGIHKISYQNLFDAGIPVSSIPISTYQVFGKQKEQPLAHVPFIAKFIN